MKRYFIVSDIEWDTEEALPEEIGVVASEEDIKEWETKGYTQDEINDEIINHLSDEYEWCISSCFIIETTEKEYKTKFNLLK